MQVSTTFTSGRIESALLEMPGPSCVALTAAAALSGFCVRPGWQGKQGQTLICIPSRLLTTSASTSWEIEA